MRGGVTDETWILAGGFDVSIAERGWQDVHVSRGMVYVSRTIARNVNKKTPPGFDPGGVMLWQSGREPRSGRGWVHVGWPSP